MTASSRMRSGVTFLRSSSALAPSIATSAVMFACSSALVRKPRASGESSTTSTISRRRVLPLIITQRLQVIHHFAQAEMPQKFAQRLNGRRRIRLIAFQFIQAGRNTGRMTNAAERDDAVDLHAVGDMRKFRRIDGAANRQRQF